MLGLVLLREVKRKENHVESLKSVILESTRDVPLSTRDVLVSIRDAHANVKIFLKTI
jgi:hypothetical protein